MKQLIAPALWQYPLTDEGMKEAMADAETYANELWKSHNRYKHTLYVVVDRREGAYFGPMGEKRRNEDFKHCEIVYTANPESE
jgi:hypothetical protein